MFSDNRDRRKITVEHDCQLSGGASIISRRGLGDAPDLKAVAVSVDLNVADMANKTIVGAGTMAIRRE